MFCMLIEKKKCHGSNWDDTKKPISEAEDVVATNFLDNPRHDKMDFKSDCSTPTLCNNEKEKDVIKEPQNKDTKFTPPLEEGSLKEGVVATKFLDNPRHDKMDFKSDCSTPTLCSNEKEKDVIKEQQNKDTKFTPPLEEVSPNFTTLTADVEGVGVNRNVKRRLLASHSSMAMNANMISKTCELHVGPAYIIENHGTIDRNGIHVSRVFDHFRNTCMDNIGLDCRSDDPVNASRLLTPSEKRVSATTIIRNHKITHGTIIPISKTFDGFRNMGNAAF
nr:hypothetical protein [Tanacetum cinerariifolium]